MDENLETLPPAPDVTANETEKELVELFAVCKEKVKSLEEELKAATAEYEDVESRLLKLLEDDDKKSSARYEGLGHVTRVEGQVYANIQKGQQNAVLEYLRSMGREDMIKTVVHSATLTSFVNQCLKQNEPLPPGVTHYRPKWLTFYPTK